MNSAYFPDKLAVIPAAGGAARGLTKSLDRAVTGQILWSPDKESLRVVVEDDRTSYVAKVSVSVGAVDTLTTGQRTTTSISPRPDGSLALLVGTAGEPNEVYAFENGALRRLSHQNDAWLADVQLAKTEDFSCTAKDGTVVNGIVRKPAGFIPGRTYPTLLIIHGGPNGQDDHGFDFQREFLAATGYVVLLGN